MPETAVDADTVRPAPMLGGPFVPATGTRNSRDGRVNEPLNGEFVSAAFAVKSDKVISKMALLSGARASPGKLQGCAKGGPVTSDE